MNDDGLPGLDCGFCRGLRTRQNSYSEFRAVRGERDSPIAQRQQIREVNRAHQAHDIVAAGIRPPPCGNPTGELECHRNHRHGYPA
jgi:hypothetical protein